MATAISPANFAAALGECYDAVAEDDVASAKKWYALAEIQHAGLAQAVSGDGLGKSRRDSLDAVLKAIEVIATSTPGGGLFEIHSRMVP